jgi:hypothetical protein
MWCAHYRDDADSFACDAYPQGVPEVIVLSSVDHRKPYVGDRGIQFRMMDDPPVEFPTELFAEVFDRARTS